MLRTHFLQAPPVFQNPPRCPSQPTHADPRDVTCTIDFRGSLSARAATVLLVILCARHSDRSILLDFRPVIVSPLHWGRVRAAAALGRVSGRLVGPHDGRWARLTCVTAQWPHLPIDPRNNLRSAPMWALRPDSCEAGLLAAIIGVMPAWQSLPLHSTKLACPGLPLLISLPHTSSKAAPSKTYLPKRLLLLQFSIDSFRILDFHLLLSTFCTSK
jgi:hypothetical protein